MKRIFFITFLLSYVFTATSVSAQYQVPKMPTEPVFTDEEKAKMEEKAEPALTATYEERKSVIVIVVDEALKELAAIEADINADEYLSDAQKTELVTIVNSTEALLTEYKTAVQGTTNSSELLAVNQAYVQKLITNKDQIKKAFWKVYVIGVEETIETTREFLLAAEEASATMNKECPNADTSAADAKMAEADQLLKELEGILLGMEQAFSDGVLSQEEIAQLERAIAIGIELTELTFEIAEDLEEASLACPVMVQ